MCLFIGTTFFKLIRMHNSQIKSKYGFEEKNEREKKCSGVKSKSPAARKSKNKLKRSQNKWKNTREYLQYALQ